MKSEENALSKYTNTELIMPVIMTTLTIFR
ncbi:Uncharacterised protein [Serratia marcescens]|nr:Uncharacterised protein [Serratia marcescens]CVC83882.1 Uncharacterised protein [Serratia sp. 2880STDY5682894]CUY98509.1 Uncharacterised protein [Serratia marcescens]CUZ19707.1 Uncharacterised protein [Serratia marcescens]CUZ26761.1 Uncharacterised protein [Serratia marcescens]